MDEQKEKLAKIMTPVREVGDLDVPLSIVIDLIYRLLFSEGDVSVSRFGEVIRVHAQLLDDIMSRLKQEHMVEISKTGALGRFSYTYRLTEEGTKRAREAMERSQYVGPVPVSLDKYREAIMLQAGGGQAVRPDDVQQALRHLILPKGFHRRIGPAVNAGTSLFLYGPPGNGKTTIAQSIAQLLAGVDPIWLPYALTVGGQIIQIYDPLVHLPAKSHLLNGNGNGHNTGRGSTASIGNGGPKIDKRWELFKRPAVMVGGELKMDALDLRFEPVAKFYEAPLQLKANGGMFLIDDFGRQQMSPQELLNRWIVPLESGVDFLRLQSGQTIEVPFRQLIVFSTNLDPEDLVDDAFLRRIQMKVEVTGPDEKMYYEIFKMMCRAFNVDFDQTSFVHLLRKWYRQTDRTMQAVHPRDILKAVVSICRYEQMDPHLSPELIDEACISYFVN
ncbi:MAG: ATP-binding protein [bacterium]